MATLLDEIIDGSSNDNVRTSDLLRKVQVAATRIGAPGIVEWVRNELQGYDQDATLPRYRTFGTPVMGHFMGPMQNQTTKEIPPHPDFPDEFILNMREPLVTLESFADGEGDPKREWPAWTVKAYEESEAFTIQFYTLFAVWNVISRQVLLGLIDTVRSKAMEFALELQTNFPEAGSVDGPSVAKDSAVAPVIFNTTNNIYGHGSNIATGYDLTQKHALKGNLPEFEKQLKSLGLTEEETTEFSTIVSEEKSINKPRFRAFLERVQTQSAAIGAAVPPNIIAGSLIELAKLYLGLS